MSAKLGAIIDRKPKSKSDHGACSLLDPHPKLAPAIKIFDVLYGSQFKTKSFFILNYPRLNAVDFFFVNIYLFIFL